MEQYIDHHSFLVEHNLFTDEMKDNIAMAGYCIVEEVKDVGTTIDFNDKVIKYNLLLPGKLFKNLKLLERFKKGESIGFWNGRRLKSFLKKKREIEELSDTGTMGYRLEEIANKFVKAYLNSKWSANVEIFNADDRDESENFRLRCSGDREIN